MSEEIEVTINDGVKLQPAPYLAHVAELSVDWRGREIFLDDEIEEETGAWFWTMVRTLGEGPITVHLNTPGGDVTSMYAIHDAIRWHGKVRVIAYGQVCSAGVLILACAHDRLVGESTVLMSHEASGEAGELGYRAARDRRKADDWMQSWWCELMARYTPRDAAWWKRKTERQAEYWLLGGEAIVEAGLADEVLR